MAVGYGFSLASRSARTALASAPGRVSGHGRVQIRCAQLFAGRVAGGKPLEESCRLSEPTTFTCFGPFSVTTSIVLPTLRLVSAARFVSTITVPGASRSAMFPLGHRDVEYLGDLGRIEDGDDGSLLVPTGEQRHRRADIGRGTDARVSFTAEYTVGGKGWKLAPRIT